MLFCIYKKLSGLLLVLPLFFLLSCSKKGEIVFNPEDTKSLTLNVEWAVITVPYAPFYEDHDYNSKVLKASRQGKVLEVKGKYLVPNPEGVNAVQAWYCFDQGWLDGSCLRIYDNRLKARSAALEFESSPQPQED